jgi:hypothetical protein
MWIRFVNDYTWIDAAQRGLDSSSTGIFEQIYTIRQEIVKYINESKIHRDS